MTSLQRILAIDAGGTTTRALIVDASGHTHGFGQAGGGNPISSGFEAASLAVVSATRAALEATGVDSPTVSSALVALAGGNSAEPTDLMATALAEIGLRGPLHIESDLLAMFCSGTPEGRGYVLIAGTGAVAGRITDAHLDFVSDGVGWLLGDGGSGFWIGRKVARAVAAELDGRGPSTALTPALLDMLGLGAAADRTLGRPQVQLQLIRALYGMRPIELARFSPLAFAAADDEVAQDIRHGAATQLANTFAAVHLEGHGGPIVVGGSVLRQLSAQPPLSTVLQDGSGRSPLITVDDGVVGAAVLALRRAQIAVDNDMFTRITLGLAELRRKA
ncbi:MAG: N-acetylglucosamine kinase [Rhodoglobus sp.]